MPYRICKTFEIESGHILSKHPERCRFPHGHSRRVEVVLEADTLDQREMICDYKVIKAIISGYLDTYDHAMCINTDDPKYSDFQTAYGERLIPFKQQDPTSEIMAKTIFDACEKGLKDYLNTSHTQYPLRPEVRIKSIRVWESSSAWAEYSKA
jgi:6-pyruvoyltetrahydropterin/6-carboxytetrahydropterin synthase